MFMTLYSVRHSIRPKIRHNKTLISNNNNKGKINVIDQKFIHPLCSSEWKSITVDLKSKNEQEGAIVSLNTPLQVCIILPQLCDDGQRDFLLL